MVSLRHGEKVIFDAIFHLNGRTFSYSKSFRTNYYAVITKWTSGIEQYAGHSFKRVMVETGCKGGGDSKSVHAMSRGR